MVYEKILNKKGASLELWVASIILSAAFMLMLGIVITGMNNDYGQNNDPTAGLGYGGQKVVANFEQLESSIDTNIESGTVSFIGAVGLILTTSWEMVKVTWTTLLGFLTGGWIESASNIAHIPSAFTGVLLLLFALSVGFLLIKLLFNRTT